MSALVTGGSGALGSAICRALGAAGHAVAVAYHTHHDEAARVVEEIHAQGGRALAVGFDVTDPEATESAVAQTAAELGDLEILVHAAAEKADALAADLTSEVLARIFAVNVSGAMLVTRAALPWLLSSGRGRIILLSSVLASRPVSGVSAYAATKGAIESLTRALAVELGPKGVTVNAVAPGFVNAGLGRAPVEAAGEQIRSIVPLRRPGTPGEIAQVVAFLASAGAAYVNGAVIPVDGGLLAGARLETTARSTMESVRR